MYIDYSQAVIQISMTPAEAASPRLDIMARLHDFSLVFLSPHTALLHIHPLPFCCTKSCHSTCLHNCPAGRLHKIFLLWQMPCFFWPLIAAPLIAITSCIATEDLRKSFPPGGCHLIPRSGIILSRESLWHVE